MLLIPYEIETLIQHRPWANWGIVTLCTIISLLALFAGEDTWIDPLVLDDFSLPGLFGHVLLHADLIHLAGNMIFLWVFGNAVCANIGNLKYLAVFVAVILLSATAHNLLDGNLAIGASGAINGIVGFVLAMYPLNRVSVFWFFLVRWGSFSCKACWIILAWFAFDIWGVVTAGESIAYWAHIGGLVSGLVLGLGCLQPGWIRMTDCDNRCLLEILTKQEWE